MKMINELKAGDHEISQYLVGSVSKGTQKTGEPFLSIELKDASGLLNCKKWHCDDADNDIFVNGNVVKVELDISMFKEALQGTIVRARILKEEEIDVTRFVKKPPIEKEVLKEKFEKLVSKIKDEECLKFINYFLKKFEDKFYDHPAASSIHHEYSSGLLMHTTSMLEIADFLADKYPDVDKDILMTGTILHDIGKIIELEGNISFHYSLEGKLLGHISIMCSEIRMAANELNITGELPILLEHMILSHHGQLEYGSPVLPLTKEALLLSMIDNLDSKMTIVEKALEDIPEGECSQKVYPLDGRSFYKPKKKA